ncbi:MAG TPA: DUF2007 domain-containing protein [Bacteroidia bacterium]|jgi:hypothetical protein
MTDQFVTIRTYSYPHEVAIIRGRLKSEGIECFVKDELTVQVNPFYSNAIGGVKLQVRESDLERAEAIIQEGINNVVTAHADKEKKGSEIICPSCGSSEVSQPRLTAQAFAISVLLLGFPLPFMSRECHCFDCGHDFKYIRK